MLEFDAETARLLSETCEGSDFIRRRAANAEALAARSGDRVVDILVASVAFVLVI